MLKKPQIIRTLYLHSSSKNNKMHVYTTGQYSPSGLDTLSDTT